MRTAFEGKGEVDDAAAEAAKVWFLYANEVIEKLSKGSKSFQGKLARAGDACAGKEWNGFSEERLNIWRDAGRGKSG